MPSTSSHSASRSECETRSARIQEQLGSLWIPGRRTLLLKESYDVGYVCREIGASDLAETNFRRAISLMEGRSPERSRKSLAAFQVVAACHNLLGLIWLDARRMIEAIASFDRAIEVRRDLRRLFPQDRENEVYLGGALCNRGHAAAESDPPAAAEFYRQSLAVLRQPTRPCECSYWDENRQSWWCEQLEALGQALKLEWVALAPCFIDHATEGLRSLEVR